MATINNYLPVIDLDNDRVTQEDGNMHSPSISIADLVQNNPRYTIQQNSDGQDKLCVTKEDTQPLWMTLQPSSGPAYSIKAINFEPVDYVGGHPIHRPGGKP